MLCDYSDLLRLQQNVIGFECHFESPPQSGQTLVLSAPPLFLTGNRSIFDEDNIFITNLSFSEISQLSHSHVAALFTTALVMGEGRKAKQALYPSKKETLITDIWTKINVQQFVLFLQQSL